MNSVGIAIGLIMDGVKTSKNSLKKKDSVKNGKKMMKSLIFSMVELNIHS